MLASIAIAGACLTNLAVDASELLFGSELNKPEPDLAASLVVAAVGLGALVLNLLAAVAFCVWIHRAASNLPALGRYGMKFTPGWCVGWFFIPFANLVKPFQAVKELWRASHPNPELHGT